ncbi:MAG: N-acetylneuraminate synthase [Candidatus Magnetoglobus multicellularis str. Araruama]|uniref:N-acetylneuraminate synthase n=1 Tax=Candidatus Magnetoglobus multicellularis str. Araruama TaxID=890399 RepID=A0A1V1P9Z0_9BACT|nr:MAG: N-acetylneuraminate synthase [Candidatus Magnetoglobus multicellularis str. Araruama]
MLLSTGMSYHSEVMFALNKIYSYNKDVILMQCSADYPLKDEDVNLSVLNSFNESFDMLLGYSDHSFGIGAAPYAVAMGAKVIEKHFTIDKTMKGPDHSASLSPEELKQFVQQIRQVEVYLGNPIKMPAFSEIHNRELLQKKLVASRVIQKGENFSDQNVIAKRTGGKGISPLYYENVFGRMANKYYNVNDVIEI